MDWNVLKKDKSGEIIIQLKQMVVFIVSIGFLLGIGIFSAYMVLDGIKSAMQNPILITKFFETISVPLQIMFFVICIIVAGKWALKENEKSKNRNEKY